MKQKGKIGLVTWLGGPNFGTVLQSYALFTCIRKLGYRVTVIRRETFIYGIKLALGLKRRYPDSVSARKAEKLRKEEMSVKTFITKTGHRLFSRNLDAFVCGSDQMWNTRFAFDPDSFLAFAGRKTRISYAPSIGAEDFEPSTKEEVRKYLMDFNSISVREETGRRAVAALTGRTDVKVVLDPVFLLGKDRWKEFASKADNDIKGKYLLCYLLRDRPDYDRIVKEAAEHFGTESTVIIASHENPGLSLEGATIIRDGGPRDFVDLIIRATAVVTDSFHGTAFSIIFHSRPVVLKRFDDNDGYSQNSRLTDLLSTMGMTGCLYENNWRDPIDWENVDRKLEKENSLSSIFLKKALEDVG